MTEKNAEPDFVGLITLNTDDTDGTTADAVCGPDGCGAGETVLR